MKKILFIDRDGTLIEEPPGDYQVDRLDKFAFVPGVITGLGKICRELDYLLVMVTNQDGLGTSSFPEATFWPYQNLMINTLTTEGIHFEAVHVDRSFDHEGSANRKPGTGMLTSYLNGDYDLSESFVIGDRMSDIQLAKNLGSKGILFKHPGSEGSGVPHDLQTTAVLTSQSWKEIYSFLKTQPRRAKVERTTDETSVYVRVDLDGSGLSLIDTGLRFFDHMLDQIARHGGIDLEVKVRGDLEVDQHHTIEDTAISLGSALREALGKKVGIQRYGFFLPMDDCAARVAIDFGGRPWLVWEAEFKREMIGDVPTEMFMHFFKSLSDHAACNLNIWASGDNEHHKIESIFKAFARALRFGIERNVESDVLPTTKGAL